MTSNRPQVLGSPAGDGGSLYELQAFGGLALWGEPKSTCKHLIFHNQLIHSTLFLLPL